MYEKSITREHRTAFGILIDQSGSMAELIEYEGRLITKAAAVAEVTNLIIGELMERANRQDGVRDYYDIAVVGYSGGGVESMLSEGEEPFVSIKELSLREVQTRREFIERRLPNTEGTTTFAMNVHEWIKPHASGETPMYEALNYMYDALKVWCAKPANFDSFPPMVFNITDGESSDCSSSDMQKIAREMRTLATSDGEVFMINIHIASSADKQSMLFPTYREIESCTNRKAKELGYASSVMPSVFDDMICDLKGVRNQQKFIGMSYNTSIEELIAILNIGTISVKRG